MIQLYINNTLKICWFFFVETCMIFNVKTLACYFGLATKTIYIETDIRCSGNKVKNNKNLHNLRYFEELFTSDMILINKLIGMTKYLSENIFFYYLSKSMRLLNNFIGC